MTMLTRISSLNKKNSLWPLAVLGSLLSSPPSTTSSPSTNGFLKINLLTTTHSFQESTWFHASKFPGRVSSHIILSHIIGWNSQVSRKANCQTSATPIINARDPHHSFNLLTMGLLIINAESLMNLDLLGIRLLNQSALQHHVWINNKSHCFFARFAHIFKFLVLLNCCGITTPSNKIKFTKNTIAEPLSVSMF